MDTIQELKDLGAEITSMSVSGNGIVSVEFKVNGAHIKAQSDIDHRGLYGIQVANFDQLKLIIEATR